MQRGFVRIIGGKWRGRKLPVPTIKNLRPTPDRVRETVFNWLQSKIIEAHCLDAFAGSGAFGFEALSRGAAHAVLVDQSSEVVKLLREQSARLGAEETADIYQATLPSGLKAPAKPFDIVFLDPPYETHLIPTCLAYLEQQQFLAPQAYFYLEANAPIKDNDLPPNWDLLKSEQAGQVYYHLARRESKRI